jgi:hypothetical protein
MTTDDGGRPVDTIPYKWAMAAPHLRRALARTASHIARRGVLPTVKIQISPPCSSGRSRSELREGGPRCIPMRLRCVVSLSGC